MYVNWKGVPQGEYMCSYFATGIQRGVAIEQSPIFQKLDDGPKNINPFKNKK
jgi:hypothetical protein